ncbi:MAG TPA: rRNA maturation RNase YbeY [Gemmatimonadota bacterium]|nr:rRNA maturation RNase YbeY [Gemmatimonadota bacterium]
MRIAVRFHPSVPPPADLDPFPGAALARLLESEWPRAEGEVHCVLTGSAELGDLNRRFRGIDAPTDVLAFPYDPEVAGGSLGDVFVSLPHAEAQAAARKEPVGREIVRLFVHGALHLAGRDHRTPAAERAMIALQEEWVARLAR